MITDAVMGAPVVDNAACVAVDVGGVVVAAVDGDGIVDAAAMAWFGKHRPGYRAS